MTTASYLLGDSPVVQNMDGRLLIIIISAVRYGASLLVALLSIRNYLRKGLILELFFAFPLLKIKISSSKFIESCPALYFREKLGVRKTAELSRD